MVVLGRLDSSLCVRLRFVSIPSPSWPVLQPYYHVSGSPTRSPPRPAACGLGRLVLNSTNHKRHLGTRLILADNNAALNDKPRLLELRLARRNLKPETANEHEEHNLHLDHSEAVADTVPRSGEEGHEVAPYARGLLCGNAVARKAVGVEGTRVGAPDLGRRVDVRDRGGDFGALGDVEFVDFLLCQ